MDLIPENQKLLCFIAFMEALIPKSRKLLSISAFMMEKGLGQFNMNLLKKFPESPF